MDPALALSVTFGMLLLPTVADFVKTTLINQA